MSECKYVSKAEAKKIRKEIWEILNNTNKGLKEETFDFHYSGFSARIVGSAKRNMILQKGNSIYDTDIQIEYNGKKTKEYPNNFKHIFHEELKKHLLDEWTSEISTSVITINKIENKKLVHSFDLAIIRVNNDRDQQKREINKGKTNDKNSKNKFVWNELPNFNLAYSKWKRAKGVEIKDVKEKYKQKKCNRIEDRNDETYKSSSSLFIESVNETIDN